MVRISFAEELDRAEHSLMAEGELARTQLERVLEALEKRDPALAETVIAGDDRVDDVYLAIESRIFSLLALQSPVARDLRLVSAIIHSNLHLERIGDLCVNVAKFVRNNHSYPTDSPIVVRLRDMGDRAIDMLGFALASFAARDADAAEELPEKDNALDRLNRGLLVDLKEVPERRGKPRVGYQVGLGRALSRADRRPFGGHRRAGLLLGHRDPSGVHRRV